MAQDKESIRLLTKSFFIKKGMYKFGNSFHLILNEKLYARHYLLSDKNFRIYFC